MAAATAMKRSVALLLLCGGALGAMDDPLTTPEAPEAAPVPVITTEQQNCAADGTCVGMAGDAHEVEPSPLAPNGEPSAV